MNIWKAFSTGSILVLGMASASLVFASGESSGGGGSVVCRDAQGRIRSAELYDFFEGEARWGVISQRNVDAMEVQIRKALARVVDVEVNGKLVRYAEEVIQNKSDIPVGVALAVIPDAYPILNRKGCQYEQVARYAQSGKVYIDTEIFSSFGPTDQAGLIVHEAVYRLFREKNGTFDSTASRRITAVLFASRFDAGPAGVLIGQHLGDGQRLMALPEETKEVILRVKLNPVGYACGAAGVVRAWLLNDDLSPSNNILFTGDLEEGKYVEFKLPSANALRGRAVALQSVAAHVNCSGWLGIEGDLIDAQTRKYLSGSSWKEGANVSPSQMVKFPKHYEFEVSKSGLIE